VPRRAALLKAAPGVMVAASEAELVVPGEAPQMRL